MFKDQETLLETIVDVFAHNTKHNTHEDHVTDVSFVALFFIFLIGY